MSTQRLLREQDFDFTGWTEEARLDLLNKKAELSQIEKKILRAKNERKIAKKKGDNDEFLRMDYITVDLTRERRSLKAKIDYRVKKGGELMKRPHKNRYSREERTTLVDEFEKELHGLEKRITFLGRKKESTGEDERLKDLAYARSKRIAVLNKINYHRKILLEE